MYADGVRVGEERERYRDATERAQQGARDMMLVLACAFHDKRATSVIMFAWMIAMVFFTRHIGIFDTEFMTFGPSSHTRFMGAVLNTWSRWSFVAVFSFSNAMVHEFVTDALQPWIQNTIQDHKCIALPYHKLTCHFIATVFVVYSHTNAIFAIFMYMSQVDFLLFRLMADMLVTAYSNHVFMTPKIFSPYSYASEASVPQSVFRLFDCRYSRKSSLSLADKVDRKSVV